MKQLFFISALLLYLIPGFSQCPGGKPPFYKPPGLFDFYTIPGYGITEIQQCGLSADWIKGVYPKNNSGTPKVRWKCDFGVDSEKSKLRYKIKIYKILSSKNVKHYINYDKVFESSIIEKNDHYKSKLYTEYFEIPVSLQHTYRAELHYQTKNSGAWPPAWKQTESNTWNVYSMCLQVPAFKINGNSNNTMTLPLSGSLTMDLANAVTCTEHYFISVQESDASWKSYGTEVSKWVSIPASSYNLKSLYTGFQKNKYYRVKLAVGEPWTERTVLLYLN